MKRGSAIGKKPANCATNASIVLYRAEDRHGHHYLFVLTAHTREIRQDEVSVVGGFHPLLGLGIRVRRASAPFDFNRRPSSPLPHAGGAQ